jgi:large subunit ribosomal protein L17
MPATPRKARNFGHSAAHQRLMMANLAASLFAAEAIVTTEAKAKALRPIAEKLITKAKKAQDDPMRVHRIRQIQGYLGDKEMTAQAVSTTSPPLHRAQRWLLPHPEARAAPGRQRPDGSHRARLIRGSGRRDPVPRRPNA